MEITFETEIRLLPYSIVSQLGEIVQIGNCWKDVMGLIPKNRADFDGNIPSNDYAKKYTFENINNISQVCSRECLNGMEVLIEEWGTSGVKRPTVSNLIWVLEKASQIRAACFLKDLIVKKDSDSEASDLDYLKDDDKNFTYAILKEITSNFSNLPVSHGGHFIGKGAFGVVYKGVIMKNSKPVAVAIKKLIDDFRSKKQFLNEIELLQKCTHEHILKLEGFSFDGDHRCLIYEFMEMGNLSDHLLSTRDTTLTWNQRINISQGIAEGICYLHSFSPPLVHRDLKSANILLDDCLNPKIGDFGLVHTGSKGTRTVVQTSTAFGTQFYMAPEAFRGDISIKMDTFSYGIVLLEILTGLPPYDENRQGIDLLTYVMDYEGEDEELLDTRAGFIDPSLSKTLFDLAYSCTKEKKWRPTMDKVLSLLPTTDK